VTENWSAIRQSNPNPTTNPKSQKKEKIGKLRGGPGNFRRGSFSELGKGFLVSMAGTGGQKKKNKPIRVTKTLF